VLSDAKWVNDLIRHPKRFHRWTRGQKRLLERLRARSSQKNVVCP